MTDQINIGRRAEDPKAGMTLGELYAFAQSALAHDIDPRSTIRITAGWRQQIQVICTKAEKA